MILIINNNLFVDLTQEICPEGTDPCAQAARVVSAMLDVKDLLDAGKVSISLIIR